MSYFEATLTPGPGIGSDCSYNSGDLGCRKVYRRAKQDTVELSAPRGEISETQYTRCTLDGMSSIPPWLELTTRYRFG